MRPSGYLTRPDYRITITPAQTMIEVRLGDIVLARGNGALLLDEQNHDRVIYFAPADIVPGALVPVAGHQTHCPYKGDAGYWASASAPDAPIAWSYATPYREVGEIADHIAFYADRVTISVIADQASAA